MNFVEFTGELKHRLELADTGEKLRAIRATLMTPVSGFSRATPSQSPARSRGRSAGT